MAIQRKTLGKIFPYSRLNSYEGLEGDPVRNKHVYLGIEIELEKIAYDNIPNTWTATEDHSLKVAGMEFVSQPIKMRYIQKELERLFGSLKSYETSSRCSVHIHMNVRDLTSEELHAFLILYCFFEKSLFKFSGDRWKSNYCVPLYNDPDLLKKFLHDPYKFWYKYAALNLSPIWGGESKRYGTVEFRHMKGTTDVSLIMDWCNLIVSLKCAAKRFTLEEIKEFLLTMNTTSGYYWLAEEVFGNWHKLITTQPTFKEDIESCITQSKYVFLKQPSSPINKEEEQIKNDFFELYGYDSIEDMYLDTHKKFGPSKNIKPIYGEQINPQYWNNLVGTFGTQTYIQGGAAESIATLSEEDNSTEHDF